MSTYSMVTTMEVNMKKTKNIPLWEEPIQDIKARMDLPENDSLPKYSWATAGKHLGFMIGPGSEHESWTAHTTKFSQRLTEWPWPMLGLFHHAHLQHFHPTHPLIHRTAGAPTEHHITGGNKGAEIARCRT